MQDNKEKWDKINTSGTITEKEGRRYLTALAVLAAALAILYKYLNPNRNKFLRFTLMGMLFAYPWNYFTVLRDPDMSGWMYSPGWYLLGDYWGMPGLDFLFYPVCGVLFGLVLRFFKLMHYPRIYVSNYVAAAVMMVVSIAFMLPLDMGTASITIAFVFPSIYYIMKIEKVDVILFLSLMIFMIELAGGWDFFFRSWVYWFPNNVPHHSLIWDVRAWITYNNVKVPVAIFPFFSIAGAFYIYSSHEAICGGKK